MRQRSILIVDDCDFISVPLEIALRCLDGFRVVRAFDVPGACEVLDGHGQLFSAVITDLNMPEGTGYEFIGALRHSVRHNSLPVIAMSGDGAPEAEQMALHAGANLFFCKPFSISAMRVAIHRLVKGAEQ